MTAWDACASVTGFDMSGGTLLNFDAYLANDTVT